MNVAATAAVIMMNQCVLTFTHHSLQENMSHRKKMYPFFSRNMLFLFFSATSKVLLIFFFTEKPSLQKFLLSDHNTGKSNLRFEFIIPEGPEQGTRSIIQFNFLWSDTCTGMRTECKRSSGKEKSFGQTGWNKYAHFMENLRLFKLSYELINMGNLTNAVCTRKAQWWCNK